MAQAEQESRAVHYGEQPLAQTIAAAAALRRLAGLLLSLENEHPAVQAMLGQFAAWERELAAAAAPDSAPRVGPNATSGQRLYIDHAFDIGAYNPCFPEYLFDHLDAETASGRVTFPLVYEGPPGLVHGGFLGVFFDCVTQHQNCAARLSGRTRSLALTFRRPTPILTELNFDIVRAEVDRGITSTVRLTLNGELLCSGEAVAVGLPPENSSGFHHGQRRDQDTGAVRKESSR
ncbi:MAG TPA: hypothetical protein VFQ37_00240 [Mycobacterium sp.]|nr:hypothetical protein [Mycobacterium sp.]